MASLHSPITSLSPFTTCDNFHAIDANDCPIQKSCPLKIVANGKTRQYSKRWVSGALIVCLPSHKDIPSMLLALECRRCTKSNLGTSPRSQSKVTLVKSCDRGCDSDKCVWPMRYSRVIEPQANYCLLFTGRYRPLPLVSIHRIPHTPSLYRVFAIITCVHRLHCLLSGCIDLRSGVERWCAWSNTLPVDDVLCSSSSHRSVDLSRLIGLSIETT